MRVDRLCLLSIDPARSSGGRFDGARPSRLRDGADRSDRPMRSTVAAAGATQEPGPGRRGRVVVVRNAQPRNDVRLRRSVRPLARAYRGQRLQGRTTSFRIHARSEWRKIAGSSGAVDGSFAKAEAIHGLSGAPVRRVICRRGPGRMVWPSHREGGLTDTPSLCRVLPGRIGNRSA